MKNRQKTPQPGRPTLLYAALASAMLLAPQSSVAAWGYEPFVSGTTQFNDNIRFVTTNLEDSTVLNVEAGVDFVTEVEATRFQVTPKIRHNQYLSEGDLDSDEQFLDVKVEHQGERTSLVLNVGYANQSALTSELEDTGNVSASASSKRLQITPIWGYRLTPLSSVMVEFSFRDITWDNQENTNLSDNDSTNLVLGYQRKLSPHTDANLRVASSEYSSPDTDYESTTNSIQAGVTKRYSERTEGEFLIGAWDSELTQLSVTENSTGTMASLGFKHSTETASHKIVVSQSVVPSSAGQIREDLRLTLDSSFRLNPALSWGATVYLQQSDQVASLSNEEKRDYHSFSPYIAWNINAELTLTGRYNLAAQTIDRDAPAVDVDAERNEVGLTLTYRKPKTIIY